MNETPLAGGPYAHADTSVRRTMLLVILALTPATLFGLYQFGWPAVWLFVITLIAALLAEAFCLKLMNKPNRLFLLDGSALLTGWLLAMTLPPWAPWWIGVVGALLAIIVGKQVFGGLGQNLFNPAMVARVALLISFPVEMTLFTAPQPLFTAGAPDLLEGLAITFGSAPPAIDAITGATPLGHVKTQLGLGVGLDQALSETYSTHQLAGGTANGSLGEVSALLLLAGGLLLIALRVITWHIPLTMLATLGLTAALFHLVDPQTYAGPTFHLLSGGAMLGAFFIATDLVTSPVSRMGQLVFAAGCGLLVYIIRTFSGYPEGVAFAVLLMNACVPLIDHFVRPRIYGRDTTGEPLQYPDEPEETPSEEPR